MGRKLSFLREHGLAGLLLIVLFAFVFWNYLLENSLLHLQAFFSLLLITIGFLLVFLLLPIVLIDVLTKKDSDEKLARITSYLTRTSKLAEDSVPKMAKLVAILLIYSIVSILSSVYLAPMIQSWLPVEASDVELWHTRFYLQTVVLFVIFLIRVSGKLELRSLKAGMMGFLTGAVALSILQLLISLPEKPLENMTAPQTQLIFVLFLLLDYALLETSLFKKLEAVKNKVYGRGENNRPKIRVSGVT